MKYIVKSNDALLFVSANSFISLCYIDRPVFFSVFRSRRKKRVSVWASSRPWDTKSRTKKNENICIWWPHTYLSVSIFSCR